MPICILSRLRQSATDLCGRFMGETPFAKNAALILTPALRACARRWIEGVAAARRPSAGIPTGSLAFGHRRWLEGKTAAQSGSTSLEMRGCRLEREARQALVFFTHKRGHKRTNCHSLVGETHKQADRQTDSHHQFLPRWIAHSQRALECFTSSAW